MNRFQIVAIFYIPVIEGAVLPFQQVVYGLEQEGPALVGQPALPKPLLSHWNTRAKITVRTFIFIF